MCIINKKVIPSLRFPEFANDGEWEIKTMGEIVMSFSGGTPSVNKKEYYGGNIPFIRSGEINSDHTELFLTQEGINNSSAKIVKKGTILYALYGATSGEVGIARLDGAINQAILAIKPNEGYDSLFIYYYLKNQKDTIVHNYIQGGQGNLSGAIINALSIPIPTLLEQKHIATCLFELDKLLNVTNGKVEQLRTHKKSLMQKLFPQKGKDIPEFRFTEYKEENTWEKKELRDIIKVNSGRDYKHLGIGKIPVYGTGGYMLSVDGKLSDIDAVGIGRKGTIDRPQYLKAPFWTVDTLFFLTNNIGYDIKFIYYLSQNIPWKKYGEQTGVPSLSKSSIENLEVMVPSSINEQKMIAQVLSSLDEEIELLERKSALLENHKKGLMQQLFPNKI